MVFLLLTSRGGSQELSSNADHIRLNVAILGLRRILLTLKTSKYETREIAHFLGKLLFDVALGFRRT